MELFLFFSILLQNFTFQLATDETEKDLISSYMKYRKEGVYPQMHAFKRSKWFCGRENTNEVEEEG